MGVLEVKDRKLELNDDGYLADPADWDEDVARVFAEIQGIELTDEHWKVIFYLREYWQQFTIVPMIRKLCKETDTNPQRFLELFPSGPLKTSCKLAGLPQPKGCI